MRQDLRVIIEGMDGAGKTTLINQLQDSFPGVFKLVRNELGPDQNLSLWWPEQLEQEKSNLVPLHDRFFWSELVYGPVLRKKLAVDQGVVDTVAWFLRSLGFLIYVRPHSDIIRMMVNEKPQMEGVKQNFNTLLELYDNIMMVEFQWFQDRFIRYDWNNPESYPAVEQAMRRYLAGELYHE